MLYIFLLKSLCVYVLLKWPEKNVLREVKVNNFTFLLDMLKYFEMCSPTEGIYIIKLLIKAKRKKKIFPSFCPFPNSPIWDSHDWDIRTLKKNPEKQNKFHWEIIHNHFPLSKILHFKVKNNVIEFIQPKVSKLPGIWFTNKNM